MPESIGPIGVGATRAPTIEEERERMLPLIKEFRKSIDALIQQVPDDYQSPLNCRAYVPAVKEAQMQVRVHLTNAKMWAGKMLEGLGNPFPAELADKAN